MAPDETEPTERADRTDPGGPPREHIEAKVYLADWQLERFLDFCEKELGQLPELTRMDAADLNGYSAFFELLANQADGRRFADGGRPNAQN